MNKILPLRLILMLLMDRRVPTFLKALVLAGLVYSLLPQTWAIFGYLENILIATIPVVLLLLLSPRSVIREYWSGVPGDRKNSEPERIVDVKYRMVDDNEEQ